MNRILLVFLTLGACAPVQLSPGQRMELIEQLDHSADFAKKCGLGRAEMRVRFVVSADGHITDPVVTMGPKGTAQQAACVVSQLKAAKVSPHRSGLVVRTERLLPTDKKRTDEKLLADSSGLPPAHIERVIADGKPTISACGKNARGSVTMFFLIDPEGNVADVLVESTLGAPEAEYCLLDAFKGLHFDRPRDGGYVEVVRQLDL